MGEGIFFLGLSRLLGVGTVYVTSLENFGDVLFGVGVASFIFCRRIAFLFRVAAAYVIYGEVFGGVSTLGSGAGCDCDGISAPLVLVQGSPFLADCRQVRP